MQQTDRTAAADRLPLLGLRVPPCAPVRELAATAAAAERAGFDRVLMPDSQLIWRDTFAALTAAALATSRVRLGTAVSNLATRHLTVLASAARTVQEASDGRFILGLGRGDSSVALIGLPHSGPAAMRVAIAQLRELLSGRPVTYPGGPVRLRDPAGPCPVFVAASGPRMLEAAGAVADGVIMLSGLTEALVAASLARVRAGAASAGRATAGEVWVAAYAVVTSDHGQAARLLKPLCLNVALNGGAAALAAQGIKVEALATRPRVYPDLAHAEDWDEAIAVADAYVPDAAARAFADRFCLVGSPAEIAAWLRKLKSLGVTGVHIQHPGSYELPTTLIERLAPPLLAGATAGCSP